MRRNALIALIGLAVFLVAAAIYAAPSPNNCGLNMLCRVRLLIVSDSLRVATAATISDAGVFDGTAATLTGVLTANGVTFTQAGGAGFCGPLLLGQTRQASLIAGEGPALYHCDGYRWRLLAQDINITFRTTSTTTPGDTFGVIAPIGSEGRVVACSAVVQKAGVVGSGTNAQLSVRQQLSDGGSARLCRVVLDCSAAKNSILPASFCTSDDGGVPLEFTDYLTNGGLQVFFRYDSTPTTCSQIPEVAGACQAHVWRASL